VCRRGDLRANLTDTNSDGCPRRHTRFRIRSAGHTLRKTHSLDASTGYVDSELVNQPNGAKIGEVGVRGESSSDELAWLTNVWSSLPENVRAEVLDVVRRAVGVNLPGA
jgi:hypothetical protein